MNKRRPNSSADYLRYDRLVCFMLIHLAMLIWASSAIAQAQDPPTTRLTQAHSLHKQAWAIHRAQPGWTESGEASRYIFLNMPQFYRHTVISRGESVQRLPSEIRGDVAAFLTTTSLGSLPLSEFIEHEESAVDAFIVVHQGRIVAEQYVDMSPSDRHIYFSLTKVLVSTAVALLEDRAQLDTQKNIASYLPEVRGSDWDGVPVIDILDMSSGMDCPFGGGRPDGCFGKFFVAYGHPIHYQEDRSLQNPAEGLVEIRSKRASGEAFEYQNENTLILTLLVERISGKPFDVFLEEAIWQRVGASHDALMMTAANGRSATPLGMSSTLRDLARFGLLFTPSSGEHSIITDDILGKIQNGGRPELFENGSFPNFFQGEAGLRNTYQWDHVTTEGDFYKDGLAGQGLYISPSRDLVIAFFGSWAEGQTSDEIPAVARQLAKSGLFDR